MNKKLTPLQALEKLGEKNLESEYGDEPKVKDLALYNIIKTELEDAKKYKKIVDIIKENLEYGYVFIGYNKDNEPLFQFADTKLYEEIKKNKNH